MILLGPSLSSVGDVDCVAKTTPSLPSVLVHVVPETGTVAWSEPDAVQPSSAVPTCQI